MFSVLHFLPRWLGVEHMSLNITGPRMKILGSMENPSSVYDQNTGTIRFLVSREWIICTVAFCK